MRDPTNSIDVTTPSGATVGNAIAMASGFRDPSGLRMSARADQYVQPQVVAGSEFVPGAVPHKPGPRVLTQPMAHVGGRDERHAKATAHIMGMQDQLQPSPGGGGRSPAVLRPAPADGDGSRTVQTVPQPRSRPPGFASPDLRSGPAASRNSPRARPLESARVHRPIAIHASRPRSDSHCTHGLQVGS